MQSDGAVCLFRFRTDYNIRKWWISLVKRSYCVELKITTNTTATSNMCPPPALSVVPTGGTASSDDQALTAHIRRAVELSEGVHVDVFKCACLLDNV